MQTSALDIPKQASAGAADPQPPFGVNEMRLSPREWLVVIATVLLCVLSLPRIWKHFETFKPGPDYRIPYSLSKDYWLFQRRLEMAANPDHVIVIGDSVVWGEYVRPDGTLSHFLNQQVNQPDHFVNCGVNGLFPLALEGLIRDYGSSLRNQKVLLHCNVLWMTSPKADLSINREETFNHSRLVPQFTPRIPSYRADANERLSAVLERHINFFSWINHLQIAYYDAKSIPNWTLADDGRDPPAYPNAYRNPLAPLSAGIPVEPTVDPARGPSSPRHKPWNSTGSETTQFEWVTLDTSLQWQAFDRLVTLLRDRGNQVLVVVGPFNEHLITQDQRPVYQALRSDIASRLAREQITTILPTTLPTELYADASHPLTGGYELLANQIFRTNHFQDWLSESHAASTNAPSKN
jgi:hypothetical protein